MKPSLFFAVLRVYTFSSDGKLSHTEKIQRDHLSGGSHASNSSSNIEEHESNNHFHRLVRNGELEDGFKFLEIMVYKGEIPDIISCASFIRGFCRIGKTRKADRVTEILEQSRVVLDIITYNVSISGYYKNEKKEEETIEEEEGKRRGRKKRTWKGKKKERMIVSHFLPFLSGGAHHSQHLLLLLLLFYYFLNSRHPIPSLFTYHILCYSSHDFILL